MLWRQVVLLCTVFGCAAAVIAVPVSAMIAVALSGFLTTVLVGGAIHAQAERAGPAPIGSLFTIGVLGGVGCVAVTGLVAALSGAAFVLVVGLGVCAPAPLRRSAISSLMRALGCRQLDATTTTAVRPSQGQVFGSTAAASPPSVAAGEPAPDGSLASEPRRLPDPATCAQLDNIWLSWWWRASFVKLQEATSPAKRIFVIDTRRALLDELAERDPAGFARWLNSGARAASDPTRYFTGTNRPSTRSE